MRYAFRSLSGQRNWLAAMILAATLALPVAALADVTITLNPSLPSPQLLNTNITWTANLQGAQQGHTYDYQFSAALQGQSQVVRDFNTTNSFVWVPWTVEGTYVVSVVVRDVTQQPFIVYPAVSAQYALQPIVSAPGASLVNSTTHPLVALFSVGPCTVGHSVRVRFKQNGSQASSTTNAVPCSSKSANFLVAGMLASTLYQMHYEEFATNFQNNGPDLAFTTRALPPNFPPREAFTVTVQPTEHDATYPLIVYSLLPDIGRPFTFWPTATDLAGHVVWFFPQQSLLTRFETGGNFFLMSNQVLKEYDVAGRAVGETNFQILNERLQAAGYPVMSSFNSHETRRLANGNILILGARDVASTMYQGGTQDDPVDILGDMVIILDHNFQVVWAWDAFAHQDLSREATLHEICVHDTAGCPAFSNQFQTANDWLHSNSVQMTQDGNILLSERHQDWVLKIAYNNGHGDGHIIWRMGPFGDFTIINPPGGTCGDPNVYPWFTHQHDVSFQSQLGVAQVMTLYDNGNLRHVQCQSGNSRGMVMSVSETQHTVYYQTVADLGQFSFAVGSAQLLMSLPYGLFASFDNGLLAGGGAQATEVDLNGNIVYQSQTNDGSYRAYRVRDLYTPAVP